MSKVQIVHSEHIKPAVLKVHISNLLELGNKLLSDNAEASVGWDIVNACILLRKYNALLEEAYRQDALEHEAMQRADLKPLDNPFVIDPITHECLNYPYNKGEVSPEAFDTKRYTKS